MIKVDESDPVGEVDPSFTFRDVQIRRGEDVKKYYDLEGEIGRGKFGIVYKCRDKETKLVLAAKFVSIAKRQDRKNVEREVEIMRALRHPRLIQLYDAFENDSTMCVVLEMIDGGELFERVIDDDFILTEKACTVFMRQICEGVSFIHINNIIHLDLKPENILCLTKTGNRIKIIDFGLARKFEPDKKLQVLFGTPEFVAPEVVNFDQISCATDMWSVGVICYVLLSGLSPFMGENDIETMSNVTLGKYDYDDEAFDDISVQAKDFISKLLVQNKEKRLTAEGALNHPWLYRKIPPPPPSLNTSKENLKNYLDATTAPETISSNKLTNRKSMLNAIQILADSEKQFAAEKKHNGFPVAANGLPVLDNPTIKPVKPEPIRADNPFKPVEMLINENKPLNAIEILVQKMPDPSEEQPISTLSPINGSINAANQKENKPPNANNVEVQVTSRITPSPETTGLEAANSKGDVPTIKRESPLPDTLASLVPINSDIPVVCETASLIPVISALNTLPDNKKLEIKPILQNKDENRIVSSIEKTLPTTELSEKLVLTKDNLPVGKEEEKEQNSVKIISFPVHRNEKQFKLSSQPSICDSSKEGKRKITPQTETFTASTPQNKTPPLKTGTINKADSLENKETIKPTAKESIIKPEVRQNMETILPKLNETLANMIEMPPPIVHEKPNDLFLAMIPGSSVVNSEQKKNLVSEKIVQETMPRIPCATIPTPLSLLEKTCSPIPTPLSLLNQVKINNVIPIKKPATFVLDNSNLDTTHSTEPPLKNNSPAEIIPNSPVFNLAKKVSIFEKEEKRSTKEKQSDTGSNITLQPLPPERGGLGALNQNPHPKILGITLGQTSFDESISQTKTSLIAKKFKFFEESSESNKQKITIKKESTSKFESFSSKEQERETMPFKQHLKSIPPWFSESNSTESSKSDPMVSRFDRRSSDFSCLLHDQDEETNSIWSNHINQLSARLLEISSQANKQDEKTTDSSIEDGFMSPPGQHPISWFLSQNKNSNTTRRPKHKFSKMNRDVPIGSPPQEGGREFYLNCPLFVVPGADTQSAPQSPRQSPERKTEAQCWQNSCQGTVLKMVTTEEKEKHFSSKSTTNTLSFKTDSKS
ncbi:serine/threonine-protein kinase 10-like [Cimex lectularius]|uniref:Protein kinase domain-containing protein n=1 Tax=Cimex lectularius TaxID=79782 RepID=A0A8I6TDC7_CIMLE|nr:serine/threonine-protein kinase 10-like [Cimex lectularius]